ncbi:hypothetical protein NDU88_003699 [Pleurodeles waltl]|uniref:Uncharacterized protein n=1 Tax=Pleurodeles waltl TaxID=8319 RepID=A0AAV7RDU9_PLEWA|nr:hypothetical protein NDU88_003699 [Pleurodeles waltl]
MGRRPKPVGSCWALLHVASTVGEYVKLFDKTYGIRKKLDRELTQQEDTLNALQHQIDNGDTLENESQAVRGRIGALWSRLDSYVRKDFQQRLHREGDQSGCLLTWLLRRERSTPKILSLWGPTGDRILGQTRVNAHLQEHLETIYSSLRCDASSQIREYLNGLQLPSLTDAQAAVFEAELSLEDLQGALETLDFGKWRDGSCNAAGDLYQNNKFILHEEAQALFGIDRSQFLQYAGLLRMAREVVHHEGAELSIFPEFTQHVQKVQSQFLSDKRKLQELNLEYAMSYPAWLQVTVDEKIKIFSNPKLLQQLLKKHIMAGAHWRSPRSEECEQEASQDLEGLD